MRTLVPKSVTLITNNNKRSTVKQIRRDQYPQLGILAERLDWLIITPGRLFSVSIDYGEGAPMCLAWGLIEPTAVSYKLKVPLSFDFYAYQVAPDAAIKSLRLYIATLFRRKRLDLQRWPGEFRSDIVKQFPHAATLRPIYPEENNDV